MLAQPSESLRALAAQWPLTLHRVCCRCRIRPSTGPPAGSPVSPYARTWDTGLPVCHAPAKPVASLRVSNLNSTVARTLAGHGLDEVVLVAVPICDVACGQLLKLHVTVLR